MSTLSFNTIGWYFLNKPYWVSNVVYK
jgi:hypothetical protein